MYALTTPLQSSIHQPPGQTDPNSRMGHLSPGGACWSLSPLTLLYTAGLFPCYPSILNHSPGGTFQLRGMSPLLNKAGSHPPGNKILAHLWCSPMGLRAGLRMGVGISDLTNTIPATHIIGLCKFIFLTFCLSFPKSCKKCLLYIKLQEWCSTHT